MSGAQQAVYAAGSQQGTESPEIVLSEAEQADVEQLDGVSKTIYFEHRKDGDSHAIAASFPSLVLMCTHKARHIMARFFHALWCKKEKSRCGPTRAAFPKIMGINVYPCHFSGERTIRHR